MIGLGLCGDGAPCNSDRTESIELFSWNILGLEGQCCICMIYIIYIYIYIYLYIKNVTHSGKQRAMRMLFTGLSKKMRATENFR